MERRSRRFWTWAITAGAVVVIAAAAVSGLFQIAVQAMPGYRAEIERYVREVTGRPIRIEALGLTWQYYYPSLELIGVALLHGESGEPVLRAERLRLGFGLARLIRGDTMPNRLELHGLTLDVRIDRDGQVHLTGVEAASQGASAEALQPLTQFAQLRLERCRLNVRDERRGGEVLSFGIAQAELERGLLGYVLETELALPASIGDSASFEGAFTGELLAPATWSGSGTLDLAGLDASRWLAPYLVPGTELQLTGAEARVRGRIELGRLAELDVALSGSAQARRARHEAQLASLEARVAVEFLADGWRAKLRRFSLRGADGAWPAAQGTVRASEVEGQPTVYDAEIGYLRLQDLAPWLQMLQVPAALAQLDAAAGEVRDAQLRLQGGGDSQRYSFRARFQDLALPADARPVGFAGLRGEVAGDERGGRAVLQEGPATLQLPGMLVTPTVAVESLEAEVEWRRLADGWQFGLPQFRWALLSTRGRGELALTVPDDAARSPEIDLSAEFLATDPVRAKPLMPLRWSAGLRGWLDRAIVSGSAPKGELVIKGPLRDFPFEERPTGSWALDIEARDILLAYQPDWPALEGIDATLRFRGNGLAIEATRGTVAGNPLRRATARFADFRTGLLRVEGTVAGETARFYGFLQNSPLRETFKGLLQQTQASGPSTVEIQLDIPVTQAEDTEVRGQVTLDGIELRHSALDEPIREIRGDVRFGPEGISAPQLSGRLFEVPLRGTLAPRGPKTTLLTAGFEVALDPAGQGASALVPDLLRRRASGASAWRAALEIGGEGAAPLTLSSDLAGVEIRLPPPLGKSAGTAAPLTLTLGSAPGTALHLAADYRDRFGADLHFDRGADGLVLDRGALRLGGGPLIPAAEAGLVLGGQIEALDAGAWSAALQGAGIEQQMQTLRRADVRVGRAVWGRYALRDARYQWAAQKNAWTLDLIGAGGTGAVRWTADRGGQLQARLDHLALDYQAAGEDAADDAALDPSALPVFDADVRSLVVGPAALGRVTLRTARTAAGQRLETLKAEGGILNLGLNGEWRRRAGQSSASLKGELATSDIATLLRAFGYTPNLDAKSARFQAALAWPPSEQGIVWHQAEGTVHLAFENGQLRALEPGAGRVLGLVNFYALPRRLTLNFRDVLGSGLGFDRVEGDFELRDGSAHTQNLAINGPSLRMDVRGRIGLAARDYDQQVTVYPDVSAGVTLGSLLLGGPVAGALALIAQEILDKPLDKVTELSYRVTGSWDNPQVERAPAPDDEPPARAPGPPSQKP